MKKYLVKDGIRVYPIPNFPGYYISREGDVWSDRFVGRFLKAVQDRDGYLVLTLYKRDRRLHRKVHRLILETFVGPCPEGMVTCHNNGNPADNRLENLRWDTVQSNTMDAFNQGTRSNQGDNSPAAKLNRLQVRIIRRLLGFGKLTQREIARIFNVHFATINAIKLNKSWKHI